MRLFFYGVLLENVASPSIAELLAGIGPAAPASTRGTMYAVERALGWHPVMVPGDGIVRGMVHDAGSVDVARLDAFEGPSYRRTPIRVETADGTEHEAHAYIYLREPGEDFIEVPHGDFAKWLDDTGREPLSG